MLDLYRTICKFNYFKDFDSLHHPLKVNLELDELPRSKSQQFQHVPLSFTSQDNYINFWKPLFIEELKSYIVSSKAESQAPEKLELQSYFELGGFKVMEFKKVKVSTSTYPTNSLVIMSPEKVVFT